MCFKRTNNDKYVVNGQDIKCIHNMRQDGRQKDNCQREFGQQRFRFPLRGLVLGDVSISAYQRG